MVGAQTTGVPRSMARRTVGRARRPIGPSPCTGRVVAPRSNCARRLAPMRVKYWREVRLAYVLRPQMPFIFDEEGIRAELIPAGEKRIGPVDASLRQVGRRLELVVRPLMDQLFHVRGELNCRTLIRMGASRTPTADSYRGLSPTILASTGPLIRAVFGYLIFG